MAKAETNRAEEISWQEFLVERPPGRRFEVLVRNIRSSSRSSSDETTDIEGYCHTCEGMRFFACNSGGLELERSSLEHAIITYVCRNCTDDELRFAVLLVRGDNDFVTIVKFGQHPRFGPRVDPKLIELIKPDRDMFLQGRRAESQGMGIGAYAYYRRVVENQKDRLFDELIRAAKKDESFDAKKVAELEKVKGDFQFSRVVKDFKELIPAELLIEGRNPLTLLHNALSKGIHSMTDGECLKMASNIRMILATFAERLALARKNKTAINEAISAMTAGSGGSKT